MKTGAKTLMAASALLASCLVSCGEQSEVLLSDASHSIFVLSDPHLLANELLSDSNVRYRKNTMTGDGRVQEMDYEILQEFASIVNRRKPKAVMVTGDLSFDGEYASHAAFASLLSKINPATKVLVIPGNHDTCMYYPATYVNDQVERTARAEQSDFKAIYADYGYAGALSYDADTLSYFCAIDDSTYALMLDTTLNRYNEQQGEDIMKGYLNADTLSWVEGNLKKAQEEGKRVISFTHHNLLDHNPNFIEGYTLENAEEVRTLLLRYGVNLNFSGHLHIQSIASADGFYDVASESVLDYGIHYGELKLGGKGISYETHNILGNEKTEYAREVFVSKYKAKAGPSYSVYGEHASEVLDLVARANAEYFSGNCEKLGDFKKEPAYQYLEETSSSYDRALFDSPSISQNHLSVNV